MEKLKPLFTELKEMGAIFVNSQKELLNMLNVSEENAKTNNGDSNKVVKHLHPDDSK